jgi:dephospho-CoA kinase
VRVGLTGGVGSGKSTVAALLAEHGAVVIDADALAREVVEPGGPGFAAGVARFGSFVVADGRLDRAALATLVFGDARARADLNAIIHPLVGRRAAELMAAAPSDAIVVYDVPLLVEADMAAGFDVVIVVEAPSETRLVRLQRRGLSAEDATARMAAQAGDAERRAVADVVIENDGSQAELTERVDELWTLLAQGVGSP